jgi:glycosyltransferase involved in cell wall biosynthesis
MRINTEAPLVSVIVPIYNVAIYLHQCVNSLLEQSYKNIEIILVNDGSTDDGRIICESFAKKDDRVRVIHQKNKGLVSARKLGLANTSGDYIFNLDGDDWLDPACIDTLVNHAVLDDVDIVISGYYREFVGLEVLIPPRVPAKLYNREGIVNEIFPKMIFDCNVNTHGISTFSWGKLFKRKLILQHQFDVPEDITVGEDSVVTYPCIGNAKNLMVIDKPLYFYRQRTKSMLKSTSSSGNEVARIHRMCDFLQNKMKNIEYDFNSQI